MQTALHCSEKLLEEEKRNGLIELDLPIPDIERIEDLKYVMPSNDYELWTSPINLTDANSVISHFIRAANKCWYLHSKNLGLPSITIDSIPIDTSVLNEIAKSALSLDLQLELDNEGLTTANELSIAFSKSFLRLCTIPIQFSATWIVACFEFIRVNCAC